MPSKPHTDPAAWTPCGRGPQAANQILEDGDASIVLCPTCRQPTRLGRVKSASITRRALVCGFCHLFYPLSAGRKIPETKRAQQARLAAQTQLPGVDGFYGTDPDKYKEPLF